MLVIDTSDADDDEAFGYYRDVMARAHVGMEIRTAVNNVRDLRLETGKALPAYTDIFTRGTDFLDDTENGFPFDPYSPGAEWYRPRSPRFWAAAAELFPDRPPEAAPRAQAVPTDVTCRRAVSRTTASDTRYSVTALSTCQK